MSIVEQAERSVDNDDAAHPWEMETHSYNKLHYRLSILLNQVMQLQPRTLLDLGCGVGVFRSELLKRYGNYIEYYGIDISKSAVKSINDPKVVVADLNHYYPFQDEIFDCIVGSGIIEYVIDLDAFMRDTRHRLRDNGHFIVTYFNMNHFWRISQAILGRKPYSHPQWKNELSYSQLRGAFHTSGFRICREVAVTASVYPAPSIQGTCDPSPLRKKLIRSLPDLFVHTKVFTLQKIPG